MKEGKSGVFFLFKGVVVPYITSPNYPISRELLDQNFTVLEPHDQAVKEFCEVRNRQSLKALKLRNALSGTRYHPKKNVFFSLPFTIFNLYIRRIHVQYLETSYIK